MATPPIPHNTDAKKPGEFDRIAIELRARLAALQGGGTNAINFLADMDADLLESNPREWFYLVTILFGRP